MKYLSILAGFVCLIAADKLLIAEPAVDFDGIAKANNAFALDLYGCISPKNGNFVFSPFSINTVLSMTSAGARGETARQMASVLHLSQENTNVPADFGAFITSLVPRNELECQCVVANSLWAQAGYPFLPAFQKLVESQFGGTINQIDLTGWPKSFDPTIAAAARKRINEWVTDKTRGKIQEILPAKYPSPNTRLILANAVYFKGFWREAFERQLTRNDLFFISPKESIPVPTMHQAGPFQFAENDKIKALELPYIDHHFSMLFMLPKAGHNLAETEQSLAVARIGELHLDWNMVSLNISIPKFQIESQFDLKQPLSGMGMGDAFNETVADFSCITRAKPFFIEDVLHKAYVKIDEDGTEAAASTLGMMTDSVREQTEKNFKLDHPFILLI